MARRRLSDVEISLAGLKRRGWTVGMVKKHLGAPDREWRSADIDISMSMRYDCLTSSWVKKEIKIPGRNNQRWNLPKVLDIEANPEVTTFLVMKKMSR